MTVRPRGVYIFAGKWRLWRITTRRQTGEQLAGFRGIVGDKLRDSNKLTSVIGVAPKRCRKIIDSLPAPASQLNCFAKSRVAIYPLGYAQPRVLVILSAFAFGAAEKKKRPPSVNQVAKNKHNMIYLPEIDASGDENSAGNCRGAEIFCRQDDDCPSPSNPIVTTSRAQKILHPTQSPRPCTTGGLRPAGPPGWGSD